MEDNQIMNNEEKMVSLYVHESITSKLERSYKRIWILCIIIFAAFVVSNTMWIYYNYNKEPITISADQKGEINLVGGGNVTCEPGKE